MLRTTQFDEQEGVEILPIVREREIGQHDVLLISMPFGILNDPSIALGLLKGSLLPLNISVKALYFTLRFAEIVGANAYQSIARGAFTTLSGEWIFAKAVFGDKLDDEGYINAVLRGTSSEYKIHQMSEGQIQDLLRLRSEVNDFLDECVERVLDEHPKIIGFTSVFQQQLASLALAKRIKAIDPDVFIVFGGANCEGAMGAETVRQFSFIDAVVSGEGDIIFPKLVQRVLQGQRIVDLQGVYTRKSPILLSSSARYPTAPSVQRMDDLPYPDFEDFFQQLQASVVHEDLTERVGISYETSRGCWWGEKNHCTFCGLNGSTMTYRSKSAQRALDELIYLVKRYPGYQVNVVDNILDMKYFKDFVPTLAGLELNTQLFYEVKANLKKEQIQMLYDAGISSIQPGIESLSDKVLTLMHKGIKGLQNIQLLKWCKEIGVVPMWNILWGFPSEPPEEYTKMAQRIPLISHLAPPSSLNEIRLDRFSPNFDSAAEFGFTNITPYSSYQYVYPFAREDVANLAYFFTYDYLEPPKVTNYITPLKDAIKLWTSKGDQEFLWMIEMESSLLIWDGREIALQPITILTGLQKALYLFCDSIHSKSQIEDLAKKNAEGEEEAEIDVEVLLKPLIEHGLMICDNNSYLSLAIANKVIHRIFQDAFLPKQELQEAAE